MIVAVEKSPGSWVATVKEHSTPGVSNVGPADAVTDLVFNVLNWRCPAFTVDLAGELYSVKFQRFLDFANDHIVTVCWITTTRWHWVGCTDPCGKSCSKSVGRKLALANALHDARFDEAERTLFWRVYLEWFGTGDRRPVTLRKATTEQVELELARRYEREQAALRDKWRTILVQALTRAMPANAPASTDTYKMEPDAQVSVTGESWD